MSVQERRASIEREKGSVRPLSDLPDVLTIAEAALVLRIGRNSAYEAARRGELPTVQVGRRRLVSKLALERLLSGSEGPGAGSSDSRGAK
jgi:excisionase family DNA binding protein